ncbi:myb-like DNA-binding protein FlbD [Exophiala viscosa]|uniref:Myb-like DNA-binding protein FlbD n=1 Tax=Exophiala viscosa TaxID=2486360 RepID=A0AAN6IHN7_9EURO|nr:myb-like DNA-binding protein FlbD [Exophiala viscosa]
MSRSSRRGPWLPEEDNALLHLVVTQGAKDWVRVSQHMQHRSAKQCRERYHQNLKPSLNHEPITAQEGELIEQLVQDMGKRWAEIARRLGNRSDNAVKNWWNGSMNRRKRTTVNSGSGTKLVGYRTQPIPASAPPRSHHPREPYVAPRDSYGAPYALPQPYGLPAAEPSISGSKDTDHPAQRLNHRPHFYTDPSQSREPSHFQPPAYSPYLQPPNDAYATRPPPVGASPGGGGRPLTLPRLHSWSITPTSDRPEWQLPPLTHTEAPLPSPAGTEASHVSSHTQAPSLVSDNQSNCSISPKTLPSPRPGLPAPRSPTMQIWPETYRPESSGMESTLRLGSAERREDAVEPQLAFAKSAFTALNGTNRPTLPRPQSYGQSAATSPKPGDIKSATQRPPPKSPSEKDTRMNLSSLIG